MWRRRCRPCRLASFAQDVARSDPVALCTVKSYGPTKRLVFRDSKKSSMYSMHVSAHAHSLAAPNHPSGTANAVHGLWARSWAVLRAMKAAVGPCVWS